MASDLPLEVVDLLDSPLGSSSRTSRDRTHAPRTAAPPNDGRGDADLLNLSSFSDVSLEQFPIDVATVTSVNPSSYSPVPAARSRSTPDVSKGGATSSTANPRERPATDSACSTSDRLSGSRLRIFQFSAL